MKMVFDARLLRCSGIGRHVSELLPRLIQRCADHHLTVLVRKEDRGHFAAYTGVRVTVVDIPMYDPRVALMGLHPAVHGADILWTPHFPHPLVGVRVVATVHDVLHLAHPELFNPVVTSIARAWLSHLRSTAAGISFVSAFTAGEFIRRIGPVTCPVVVTPNAVDVQWWSQAGGPRPRAAPYLLSIGNIKPHKGLITAVRAVMSDRNLPSLCLLGSLPWEGLPIELAAAIAAERVVILGRLDDIALRTYLQHAEALVFPSIYEGFGIPPLEAMAAGTPVIAADIPAVREICDEACLYFPVNDEKGLALALHVVLNEQHLRKSIIAAGSSRTGKFSWDRSADGLANLLLDVGAADHSQLALK